MRTLLVVCLFVLGVAAQDERPRDLTRAVQQLEAGDFHTALTTLRENYAECLRIHDLDAHATIDAQYLLAFGLIEAGHTDEGLALAKKLLDRIRDRATPSVVSEIEVLYATGLREAGNAEEAVRVLKKALARDIDARFVWRARNQLALSLAYGGRPKEAMEAAVLTLAAAPEDVAMRRQLMLTVAQLHLALGNWREAEAAAHRVSAIGDLTQPNIAVVHSTLGLACLRQGRPIDAEAHLRQAAQISETLLGSDHPEVGSVLHHLAEAVRANRRKTEAAEIRRRADDIFRRSGATVSIWSLRPAER